MSLSDKKIQQLDVQGDLATNRVTGLSRQQRLEQAAARKRANLGDGRPQNIEDFATLNPFASVQDFENFSAERQSLDEREALRKTLEARRFEQYEPYTAGELVGDTANSLAKGVVAAGEVAYGTANLLSKFNAPVLFYNALASEENQAPSLDDLTGGFSQNFAQTRSILDDALQSTNQAADQDRIDRYSQEFNAQSDQQTADEIAAGKNAWLAEAKNIGRQALDTADRYLRNPALVAQQVVEEVPSLITGGALGKAAAAGVTAKITANQAAKKELREVTSLLRQQDSKEVINRYLNSAAGKKKVGRAAEAAGVTQAAVGEAMSNAVQTKGEILNLSEKELAEGSPIYNELRAEGLSHEDARMRISEQAFDIVVGLTLPLAAISSKVTGAGKLEGTLFLKGSEVAKPLIKVAGATGIEGLEEAFQGGTGQAVQNLATRETADVTQSLTEGVGSAIGQSAVVGAGTGLTITGISSTPELLSSASKDTKKLVTNADKALKAGARQLSRATDSEAVKEARKTGDVSKVTDTAAENYSPEEAFVTLASPEFFPVPRPASEGVEAETDEEFGVRSSAYEEQLDTHITQQVAKIQELISRKDPELADTVKKELATLASMRQTSEGLKGVLGNTNYDEAIKTLKDNPENKGMLLGSMSGGIKSSISAEQANTILKSGTLNETETKQVEAFIQTKRSTQEVSDLVRDGEKGKLGLNQYTQVVTDAVNSGDTEAARTALTDLSNFAKGLQDKAQKARKAFNEVKASNDPNAEQNPSGQTWSLNFTKRSPERLVTNIEKDAKAVTDAFTSLRDYSAAAFTGTTQGEDNGRSNVRGSDSASNASPDNNSTGSQPSNIVSGGNQPTVQSDGGVSRGNDVSTQQDGDSNAGRVSDDNALTPTPTQSTASTSNLTQAQRILANQQARAAKSQESDIQEIVELRSEKSTPEIKSRIAALKTGLKKSGLTTKEINQRIKTEESNIKDAPVTQKRLEEDSLATMLAKEGGLDTEDWNDISGDFVGLKNQGDLPTGRKLLFKSGGRSPDAAAERANELGYGDSQWDANSIVAAVDDELNGGEVVYTSEGQNIVLTREAEQEQEDQAARAAQAESEVEQVPPTATQEGGAGETEGEITSNEITQENDNEQTEIQAETEQADVSQEEISDFASAIETISTGILSTGRKFANRLNKLFKVNPKENLMNQTTDLFNELDSFENITDEQKAALTRIGKFKELLAAALDKRVGMKPELNSKNPYAATDKNMLQYLMADGTITYSEGLDPNVLNLMAITAMKWLGTRGGETLKRTPADIAAMLGVREDALTDEQIKFYINEGIPNFLVSDNLGKEVMAALGITLDKKNTPREARDRMAQSIGGAMFIAMHEMNLLQTNVVDTTPLVQAEFSNNQVKENRFVNENEVFLTKMVENPTTAAAKGIYDTVAPILEKLTSIENEYQMPSLTAPTSVPKQNNNKTQDLTKSQRKALRKYAQKAFKLNTDVMMMFDLVGDDVLKFAMGYDFSLKEVNGKLSSTSTHVTKLESAKGKNNQIERSIENLKAFAGHMIDSGDINADFFFESVVDNNNRFRIKNKVVNPQGDKLHRAAMVMEGWEYTVNTEAERALHMLAVGQALGVDIDKLPIQESLKQTSEKLFNPTIVSAIAALVKLRSGEQMTLEETKTAQRRVAAGVKETGTGSHGLEGLISLMDYSATEPFTSNLSIEIDGITNGTALATLLFAPEGALKVLEKSGIFSDSNRSYGEYISKDGNMDNYNTLSSRLMGELNAIIAGDWRDAEDQPFDPALVGFLRPIGNILGKLGQKDESGAYIDDPSYGLVRSVAKNPVLIGNYGAGDNKITSEFVEEVLSKVYEHIQKAVADKDQARLDLIHQELSQVVHSLPKLTLANGLNWTMNKKQTGVFKARVKNTYGKIMNAALSKEFAGLREVRNNFNTLLNAANAMFRAAYNVEANKILKEKGFLTVADEEALEAKLAKFKPEIKHGQVLKGDRLSTHIPLNTTKLEVTKDPRFITEIDVEDHKTLPNHPNRKRREVYSPEQVYTNNGVKGTVMATQGTDSGVMTEMLLDDLPVLNIYDAIILNPMKALEGANVLNKATLDVTKRSKVYRNAAESLKKIQQEFGKNPEYMEEILSNDRQLLREEILPKGVDADSINPMDMVREAMAFTNALEAKRKAMFDALTHIVQYNMEGGGHSIDRDDNGAEYHVKQFVAEVKDSTITDLGSTPQSGNTSYSNNQTEHDVQSNTIVGLMIMLGQSSAVKSSKAHADYLMDLLGDTYNSFVTLTKLKVAKGGKLNAGEYDMNNREVRVATKAGGRTSPFEMGGDEVFAHEMIHSLTAAGIEASSVFAREVRTLMMQAKKVLTVDDFMETGGTRAEAEERYNYIFRNPEKTAKGYSVGIHEFVAFGLTNEKFRQLLRDKVDPNSNPYDTDTSFLGKMQALYSKLIRLLTNTVNKTKNLSADAKLNSLIGQMMEHEQNAKQRVYNSSITNKIESGFKTGLINYIQQPLVNFLSKDMFTQESTSNNRAIRSAVTVGQGVAAVTRISARGEFGEFRKVINRVSKRLGATENNLILALFTEMQGNTPETNKFYQLARESRKVLDQARADIAANVKTHVRNQFKRTLTSKEEVSLTKILLKTDLSGLTSDYSAEQISNLVTNELFLKQEIRKAQLELNKFGLNAMWYKKMASSLGNFMVTGEFTEKFGLKNAHAISRLVGLDKNVPANAEAAEAIIDRLATLKALEIARTEIPEDMDRVINIFKEEFVPGENPEDNGVMFTLLYHEDYKERALENLFAGNKMQTVKGYTRDIYNPNKSFQVAPEIDADLMARDGFVRLGKVSKDPADPNSLPMAIYVSDMGQMATWQAGGVSLAGMTAKGTKYYDTVASNSNSNNTNQSPNTADAIRKRKEQDAKDIFAGRTSAFPRTTLVPIIDETGKITDFHYLMKEKTKDELERNIQLADVFGAMEANMKSKTSGREINQKFTEALAQDYKTNFAANRDQYSFVGIDSDRSDLEELYKMMPPEMRADIKRETGQDGIWVRDEIIKLVFGQRKFSVPHYFKEKAQLREANTKLSNKYLTEVYRKLGSPRVAKIEQGWQETVAWIKDTIVIKSVVTLVGNVASNNVLLWSLGVPVKDLVANQERAVRYAEDYQKNQNRIQEIEREIQVVSKKQNTVANQKLIKKLEADKTSLEDRLVSSPIHELIEAGIYQSIIDDVDALDDGFNYKTRLENWVSPVTDRAPEQLKTLAGYVTLSQDNKAYQFLRRSTQLSDFAARFALHEHNMSKGMDAQQSIDMIVNVFVDYDLPTHKAIEYLNSIGSVFFTKFFLRIQKVILYTLQEEPLRFIGLHYLQELFGNVSDIADSFGLTKDIGFMFKTPLGALGGIPDMHPWLQLFM